MTHEEKIEAKAEEIRRKIKDPKIMHEIMKDAYIPVGISDVDLLDNVLKNSLQQNADGDEQNEP